MKDPTQEIEQANPLGIKKTRIANTPIEIPALCFGTSGLGDMPDTYSYSVDEARAVETIKSILTSPCPFLDTSRNYAMGRSEHRIGLAIKELGGLPNGALISTKLDRDMKTGKFDAARARKSFEESLQALGIEIVQLLHLHDPEHAANLKEIDSPDGALAELMKLKEEGLCDAIGLAAGNVDIMMPILRNWDFDAIITHNRHTLVNANAETMIEYAHAHNVAILNAAPYCGGALAKGSTTFQRYVYQKANRETLAPIARVEEICQQYSVPTGAVALQFSLRDKRIASTICGVSKPDRIAQTLQWAELEIPQALWQEINTLARSRDNPEAQRIYRPG